MTLVLTAVSLTTHCVSAYTCTSTQKASRILIVMYRMYTLTLYNETTCIPFLSKLIKQAPEWMHPHPFVFCQCTFWWSGFTLNKTRFHVFVYIHTHDNCNEGTCIRNEQFHFKSIARSILKSHWGNEITQLIVNIQ